jgi:hypothetical protein
MPGGAESYAKEKADLQALRSEGRKGAQSGRYLVRAYTQIECDTGLRL